MILRLPEFDDDDPEFLACVNRVISGVVEVYKPPQFQVFRIDNWFGPKWLGFCGKILGAVGFRNFKNVVVPPFVQNRLTAQSLFVRGADDEYAYSGDGPQIHHIGKSTDNFKNVVCERAPETVLFWFSGNTSENKRGSLMGYKPGKNYWMWYLEFLKKDRWSIARQRNFPIPIVEFMK